MAKTRRKKRNGPAPKDRNIKLVVINAGKMTHSTGIRSNELTRPMKEAKPVFVGRVYTGVNRGKLYAYAGLKRGGKLMEKKSDG